MNKNVLPLPLSRFLFRLRRQDHLRLYRKLESLLKMQRPLAEALEMLWRHASRQGKAPHRLTAVALRSWQRHLERGRPLSEAMDGWIPERDTLLLKAGEKSGHLDKALAHLLAVEGLLESIRKALGQALGYVSFLLLSLLVLILVIDQQMILPFQKIAPQLVEQTSLKTIGRIAAFLKSRGFLLTIVCGLVISLFLISLKRWTGKSRAWADCIPPWSWYRLWQGASALLGLSSLLHVQVPAPEALRILEDKASPWLQEKLRTARLHMLRGNNLGEAFRGEDMNFPDEEFAADLEIFALRGDIGVFLETLIHEWIRLKVDVLQAQAHGVRLGGMVIVGGFLAWISSALYGLYDTIDVLGHKMF